MKMKISNSALEKYPISVKISDIDIIKDSIRDQRHKIPYVWKQLDDKNEIIYMNAYEQGVITAILSDQRDKIPEIWKQLMDMMNKFRKDAGVEITDLGNDIIKMKDNQGLVVTRKKYDWEK